MTALGWLMMVASVTSVVSLTAFCLSRVLTLPPVDVHSLDVAPLDIPTGDITDAD
jgi:hypothetical protein